MEAPQNNDSSKYGFLFIFAVIVAVAVAVGLWHIIPGHGSEKTVLFALLSVIAVFITMGLVFIGMNLRFLIKGP